MIALLIVIGFLLLAVAALFLLGMRLPKTHQAASRIRLPARPERVWEIISDFGGFPHWRPGLAAVERAPDIEGLPSWYEVCAGGAKVRFRVLEASPPRRLVTALAGEHLPLRGVWVYELEADGEEATVLTITERDSIFHPAFRFFVRYVLSYHGVMDVFLLALAGVLDSDAKPEHLSLRIEDGDAGGAGA
ncbi:SRPBCC family protein [Methylococcus geothermalis]|uniref:SRPBCC family protein n=1 Tax=Methylococcus geothermalis TaxID=2681310 RepID=A0A858Q6K6_9GAMM|nr:SRPBCC family protein [Methylococcus geothermalis]QJD29498.1 SRPBCC family protein [Methylococcus geothermalis]